MVRPTGGLQLPMPGAGPVAIPSSTKSPRRRSWQAVVFPNPKEIYKSTAVFPNPKENGGLHCPSPGLKARCRVPRRCGDFGGFRFSWRGTEGQLCGGTPAVLHLGALHLMSKQHTNCFSSRSWSTAQSSVEFGCLQITLHRAGLGQPCCSSPAWNLPVLGGGGLEPLTCIFHAFSCVKTASSAFIAWYQPKKSHVVSHGDSRRCSVCLFISFDGLGLLALKLFCKLWE